MPEPYPALAEAKTAQIERINELSQLARTAWFSLLAYLVFVGITLLGVEDADFFVPSRRTQLPLVNVQIPTASFFWAAPVLGAALYTYLHLFLIKLWDAHGDARTSDADPTHHWLVNDYALIRQGEPTTRARPAAWLIIPITWLLVWIAGPLVLGYAWWRSMPAHDEVMTLLIAFCLGITLYVGLTSWWSADTRLRRRGRTPWGGRWHRPAALLAALLLLLTSWLRTEGGLEHFANWVIDRYEFATGEPLFEPGTYASGDEKPAQIVQEEWVAGRWYIPKTGWFTFTEDDWPFSIWLRSGNTWNPLASTDLADGALGGPPDARRDPDHARRRYREEWCKGRDIDLLTCKSLGNADEPDAEKSRATWCNQHGIVGGACTSRLAALANDLREEWQEEREAYLSRLDRRDQVRRDLRRANLSGAFLAAADLRKARLEGAKLVAARLEGAELGEARLQEADLREARLDGANLLRARLEGAHLGAARLDGAYLGGARLEGADLWQARLQGVNLLRARLEGAYLRGADLRSSYWAEASSRGSLAQFADFRGARALAQAQLEDLIGNPGTLLPDGPSDTGQPWYVWSCWEHPPADLDRIVATAAGPTADDADRRAKRAELLCGRHPRHRTGTPLALDAPYPEGHPLADRD